MALGSDNVIRQEGKDQPRHKSSYAVLAYIVCEQIHGNRAERKADKYKKIVNEDIIEQKGKRNNDIIP